MEKNNDKKGYFGIPVDVLTQTLNTWMVKCDESEFLYFIMQLQYMINAVAKKRGINIITNCKYSIKGDDDVEVSDKKINGAVESLRNHKSKRKVALV